LLAGLVLAGFVVAGLGDPGDPGEPGESGQSVGQGSLEPAPPSATPPPTSAPAWLDGLVRKVEKACGTNAAAAARSDLATMREEDAKDVADELADACKEAERGNVNGIGNGNGNGSD
jgi:hypothetical protein